MASLSRFVIDEDLVFLLLYKRMPSSLFSFLSFSIFFFFFFEVLSFGEVGARHLYLFS